MRCQCDHVATAVGNESTVGQDGVSWQQHLVDARHECKEGGIVNGDGVNAGLCQAVGLIAASAVRRTLTDQDLELAVLGRRAFEEFLNGPGAPAREDDLVGVDVVRGLLVDVAVYILQFRHDLLDGLHDGLLEVGAGGVERRRVL